MATKKMENELVVIRPIKETIVPITIVGDEPLIMHAWSEKAKKMMLDAQTGTKKGKAREARNPAEEFIDSMYWLTEKPEEKTLEGFDLAIAAGARFCFPVTAIKQASISAAYRKGWVKNKMELRGAFFIESDENGMVEVQSDIPIMREDMVKIGMGTADLRYRGEFRNWRINLLVRYDKNGQYDLNSIINIINAGGYVCGIGEWRPEKDGQNGTYHIEFADES